MGSKIQSINPDSDVDSNTDCSSCSYDTPLDQSPPEAFALFWNSISESLNNEEHWTDLDPLRQMVNRQK